MAGLSRSQIAETAFWVVFAAGAYALTFRFDREIEFYRYGAAGWPRFVLILIVVVALLQLLEFLKKPKAPRAAGPSVEEPAEEERERHGIRYYGGVAATLGLPFLYALLLEPVGFYALTPLFVLAYLLVAGERRWTVLVGTTLFIYAFLLVVFVVFLYANLPTGNYHPFYDFSNWLLVLLRGTG